MENNLKSKFLEAKSYLQKTDFYEGSTYPIERTEWVRIIIEKIEVEREIMNLVVEVTPPKDGHNDETSRTFDSFVEYIEYLQRLRDVGFALNMVVPGCICCASLVVDSIPEDNVFRALVPP